MTLDQLKMLITVAEHGSLKLASELLHKTQPAVSQGISKLESSLHIQVFNREKYRLELTEEGQKIYQHAKRVLAEAGRLYQIADYLAEGNETKLTIAFEASYNLSHLLPILEKTQQQFPETQIILKQEYISGAIQAVQMKVADIAISAIPAQIRERLSVKSVEIYQGGMVCVASQKLINRHPNLSSIDALVNEYQIVIQDTGSHTGKIEFGVKKGQRRWYANDFSTKKMLIQSGMGWGSLPIFLVEKELASGDLVKLELPQIEQQEQLVYHAIAAEDKIFGPVATFLWQALSE